MWGRVAVACRLNQYSTVPFTSYSMRCIKTCFIETRILTTPTFFTSHPTCWLVIVQEVKWNWSENCWVFGRLECGGLRGQPLPWFSEVSFKRISSCKMHTRSHYITKIYRPGSKCEALQLGVHLIMNEMMKWMNESQFWVFDFYETFICYRGCLNLSCYIVKKVQKNFLMGFKIWWSWGSRFFFSKSP